MSRLSFGILALAGSALGDTDGLTDTGCNQPPEFVSPTPGTGSESQNDVTTIYCDWPEENLPAIEDENSFTTFKVKISDAVNTGFDGSFITDAIRANIGYSDPLLIQEKQKILNLDTGEYENGRLFTSPAELATGVLVGSELEFNVFWYNPPCSIDLQGGGTVDLLENTLDICFMAVDNDNCQIFAGCGESNWDPDLTKLTDASIAHPTLNGCDTVFTDEMKVVLKGGFSDTVSHCVHIQVVQAPPSLKYGCTDTSAANFDPVANTVCTDSNQVENGCCEYIILNEPPEWVFDNDATAADGTHFDVCDYDSYDPRTGEAWAIENDWFRWNTATGIDFTMTAQDYNNGDYLDINFDCSLDHDSFSDCPLLSLKEGNVDSIVDYVENAGGDNQPEYVVAQKTINWTPTSESVSQCQNDLIADTGSKQQGLNYFMTYTSDNSDANLGTEAPIDDVVETELLTYTSMIRVPPTVFFDGELSHDDTISVEIGCSVEFTVLAHDCNAEDEVSLYVLEDPGLPNGATVDALTRPNGNAYNAERNFHWTPEYRQGGKTFRVCFIARDNSDICELNGWYSRNEVCVNVAVGNVGGLTWDATSGETHDTPVGCVSQTDMTVSEDNGYCINDIEFASAAVQASSFFGSDFVDTGLPDSIEISAECHEPSDDTCLGCDLAGRTTCTKTITFTPSRGDEGTCTEVCLTAQDSYGINHASIECALFCVPRCKYCVSEGDTLHDVSNDYCLSTDWLRLWNSNPQVTDPDTIFHENDVLNIGPVYHVQQGDTLRALSHRFSTTDHTILELNPDVSDSEELVPGQPLCVTPCSVKGSSSSNTYTWGY